MEQEIRVGGSLILVLLIVFGFMLLRRCLEASDMPSPASPASTAAASTPTSGDRTEPDGATDGLRRPTFVVVSEVSGPTPTPSPKVFGAWVANYVDVAEPARGLASWKVPNLPMPASTDPPCQAADSLGQP